MGSERGVQSWDSFALVLAECPTRSLPYMHDLLYYRDVFSFTLSVIVTFSV
jgi:hypothetical protein